MALVLAGESLNPLASPISHVIGVSMEASRALVKQPSDLESYEELPFPEPTITTQKYRNLLLS